MCQVLDDLELGYRVARRLGNENNQFGEDVVRWTAEGIEIQRHVQRVLRGSPGILAERGGGAEKSTGGRR